MLYMLIDLMGGAVFALGIAWVLWRFEGHRTGKRLGLLLLFSLYLCEMFNVVGIPAIQYVRWNPEVNFVPFADEKNLRYFFQIGMNAVMFVPFGFLVPMLWRCCRHWWAATLAGFSVSLVIELSQLFCFRYTDVDDLLMNTLGALVGYCLAWLLFHRKWRLSSHRDGGWRFLVLSVANPLLVMVFLRSLVSDLVYSLPMFS